MKKYMSFVLMLCLLVSAVAPTLVFAVGEADFSRKITNLALGLPYDISEQYRMGGPEADWGYSESAPVSYPDVNYELTDGIIPMDHMHEDPAWMAFHNSTPAQQERGYAYIRIDLGSSCHIGSIDLTTLKNTSAGISCPHYIEYMISEDGENYKSAGALDITSKLKDMADETIHVLSYNLGVTARYAEIRVYSYGGAYLGELEIYGSATEEPEESEETKEPEEPSTPILPPSDASDFTYEIYGQVMITGYVGKGGDVVIPSRIEGFPVTMICSNAFEYCKSLTSVVIPDSVTGIGEEAFRGCSSLTSITLPRSVTSIDELLFYGCSSLASITIPDSVTSIGDYAFKSCFSLTSVVIPDSVTSIGEEAFYNCSALASVMLPDSITSIGLRAFFGCESLTNITVPGSLTSIDSFTFGNCSSLTSVVILDGVTSIGYQAFKGCNSLKKVVIPDSVTSIGEEAFEYCKSLTCVMIPDSVTDIGRWAFSECKSLWSICCQAEEQPEGWHSDWRKYIGETVYWGVLYSKSYSDFVFKNTDGALSVVGYIGTGGDVVIPCEFNGTSVTSIGSQVFFECKSLTSITIPDSVASIGYGAFEGCHSLANILIPDSVTSIGSRAFKGCFSLASITIPDSVTNIGDLAFNDCVDLTSVVIPDSVTSIGDRAFSSTYLHSLYCEAEAQPSGWSSNWNGNATVTWNVLYSDSYSDFVFKNTDGTISIVGYIGKDRDVVIPHEFNGFPVTSIGARAFYECRIEHLLTSVVIPDSVTSIDENAFSECKSLTNVTFGENSQLTTIGGQAFDYCYALTSIVIPGSVTDIGYWAFKGCYSLTSITIPDSVTIIGYGAFYGCTGLTSITFESPTTRIFDSTETISDTTTIYGCSGSAAEEYATKYGRTFVEIGNSDVEIEKAFDVSGDGTVDQADLTMLMSVLVGNTETDAVFDFDFDGELTIYDCILLMQQID